MTKHLFLTGEKQAGKSTLLQKLTAAFLAEHPGPTGGFITKRVYGVLPAVWTVHLLPADGSAQPSEDNLLFVCRQPSKEDAGKFDTLGCAALAKAQRERCSLIVMDELGVYEKDALAFQTAVLQTLEGDIPVLGVLQQGDSDFLRKVEAHPRVQVAWVDRENREDIQRFLALL